MRFGMLLLALMVAVAGCHTPVPGGMPPVQGMMQPGPGVDGPGPGVIPGAMAGGMMGCVDPGMGMPMAPQYSQVSFRGPEGMFVTWSVSPQGDFGSTPVVCPSRQNFPQGAIYRLKLTNIPGYDAVELYPTLEIGPAMPRTQAFLAHNSIPIELTASDFEQVLAGNFVTKVIYLPDPEYQELALAGVETLVSTRLDPGVDPIVEADRRGAILGVLRLGNKDLEIPGEMMGADNVIQASYSPAMAGPADPMAAAPGGPIPAPAMPSVPSNYISGVTGPQYGMPSCGTPICLPGPPHIPLGTPAGLRKHTMVNHTPVHVPKPSSKIGIHVSQPGVSYPRVPHKAFVRANSGLGLHHKVPCNGTCVTTTGQPCQSCQ